MFRASRQLICAIMTISICGAFAADETGKAFRDTFNVCEQKFSTIGRNKYFILEPGYQLVLEGKEDGEETQLTITVLNETKKIGNVETRVVEEKEMSKGKIKEDSRNYFAIDTTTNDIYYFGEDTGGAWTSGEDGAKFGLMMPGTAIAGDRYYQEIAKKAKDRAEHLSITETLTTPAGTFKDCLKSEETTPLEPGNKEYKYYAPDVGLIKEGDLVLVKYGMVK